MLETAWFQSPISNAEDFENAGMHRDTQLGVYYMTDTLGTAAYALLFLVEDDTSCLPFIFCRGLLLPEYFLMI